MTKINTLCNKLIQEAKKSPIQYRLAACIIHNRKSICEPKCNDDRNYCRGHFCGSLHAEVRAMLTYFGTSINYDKKFGWRNILVDSKKKLKKYDIFVIRIIKVDNDLPNKVKLGNARPCVHCLDMMKSIGIRRVYYSDDFGNIIYENVKDMISIQTSKIAQRFEISKNKISEPLINQNLLNQKVYYDNIIIKKIPNVMKQLNYQYFLEYNFKSISDNYKLESKIISGNIYIDITNMSNVLLKTIFIK